MSPISFTPQQLAKSLRVDDDQQKWKVRDLALFQGVEEGVQMIHALASSEYDDGLRDVFACEFAALYLPQFVARDLWLMDVAGTTGSSLSLLHDLAVAPAFFGRWVRANLDTAVGLFVVLVQNAISTWPSMPIVKGSNHHGDPTFNFISQSLLILTLIVSHFPPPYDAQPWPSILPSSLSHSLDVALKATIRKIDSFRHDEEIHFCLDHLRGLSYFCNGGTALEIRGTGLPTEHPNWWTCGEATRRGEGVGEKTPCLSSKEGEELLVCSRCLSVRYCCRDHQKASWRTHKKTCFKPTW